mmetsp:Transcript_14108/g.33283  ORF Transcript_14108/g.33283 Transcript_14108/m.33283 type:complete len:83 (+) Transcript_14108:602-850(+)
MSGDHAAPRASHCVAVAVAICSPGLDGGPWQIEGLPMDEALPERESVVRWSEQLKALKSSTWWYAWNTCQPRVLNLALFLLV